MKTEIEWFKSAERLPETGSEVLISHNGLTITDAEFLIERNVWDDDPTLNFLSHEVFYKPEEIMYWAYLPELLEIE